MREALSRLEAPFDPVSVKRAGALNRGDLSKSIMKGAPRSLDSGSWKYLRRQWGGNWIIVNPIARQKRRSVTANGHSGRLPNAERITRFESHQAAPPCHQQIATLSLKPLVILAEDVWWAKSMPGNPAYSCFVLRHQSAINGRRFTPRRLLCVFSNMRNFASALLSLPQAT